MAACRGRCSPLEICGDRVGAGTFELARLLGRTLNGAHGNHGGRYGGNRHRQPGLPRSHLSFDRQASPARASTGASGARSVRVVGARLTRYPPLARSRQLGRALSPGRSHRRSCRKRPYRFLPVDGDGVHQIAVGPVHAGIIEPGHFRFTASGETVVRLEQRLGYTHKGIEGLMIGADLERAVQLAGRVSGDSTVAYAYAFSKAAESGAGTCRARSRGLAPCAARRTRAACQSSRRYRRHLQRRIFRADACALQRVARKRAACRQRRIRSSIDAGCHRARRRDP